MNKILVASIIVAALAGCSRQAQSVAVENNRKQSTGLERRVEAFKEPDKFGVVCYQDLYTSSNLSCVKINQGE